MHLILSKYVGVSVLKATFMVIFALISIDLFIQFSGELGDIGTGNYGFGRAFLYVLMQLPESVYQFLPVAALLGSLLSLGLLSTNSELIVMRASGVSLVSISLKVVFASLLTVIFMLTIGELIGPAAQNYSNKYKAQAMSGGLAFSTKHGTWVRNNNDFIHIEEILPNHTMKNITRYQFNDNEQLQAIETANTAEYNDNEWIFKNIMASKFREHKVIGTHLDQENWGITFKPHVLNMLNSTDVAEERSLPDLYRYIKYLSKNKLATHQYEFAFWQRVFQPLALVVMVLLSIPFVIGSLRTATMGLRILVGAIIGITFYTINQFGGQFSAIATIPPIMVALLPSIIFFTFWLFLLIKNTR
jgi:lipopolysaccharide export system permease protein